MNSKFLISLIAFIACTIGAFALLTPGILLSEVKHAEPSGAAEAMARTVGALLLCVGLLNALMRNITDRAALRALLIANLAIQLALLPLDAIAYAQGVFHTWGSFLPNGLLHVALALALTRELRA